MHCRTVDGGVAAAGVVGPVRCPATVCMQTVRGGGHGADLFALGDLVEQPWQDRAVAVAAGGEFHGADVRSGGIHGQMDLAPPLGECPHSPSGQRLAASLDAMFPGLPFAIAEELDPGAVDQQVERAVSATIWDMDHQGLLLGGTAWNSPAPASRAPPSASHAGHHALGLSRRHCRSDQWRSNGDQLEQGLDRQAELDRGIGEHRRTSRSAVMQRKPGHLLVQPPSHTCKHVLPGNGSTASSTSSARRCSWASSSCDSGRLRASSCRPLDLMDSRCESSEGRVLQQRRAPVEVSQIGRSLR